MKKSLLFLFVFVMLCLPTMAQPKIRVNGVPDKLSIIKINTSLVRNQRYYSDNKKYALVCQQNGNLALYGFSAPEKYYQIWHTNTVNYLVASCVFQADGNLVVYAKYKNEKGQSEQKALWNSRGDSKRKEDGAKSWTSRLPPYGIDSETKGSTAQANDYWLQVHDDGNLVIYAGSYPHGSLIWQSETGGNP